VDTQGARETPLDAEPFEVRVHRRLEEYNQRHGQRELEMASYTEASSADPGVERFADARKVQVELKDELDREQTSEQLASDYAEQARDVFSKEQAVQDFINKRRKTLDDLNRQNVAVNRQDLEVALANLARQPESPETQAQMREIDRRLSEAERLEQDLPARRTRAQQEAAGAADELAKLKALEQSYQKESKAFAADALSAHNNRLGLADRLEYYLVRGQAEDVLEQGRKATQSVQHLSASPEVARTLNSSGPSTTSDADLEQLRSCIQQSGDVKACHDKARHAHQE
jgi:chromosome segregation ATPase